MSFWDCVNRGIANGELDPERGQAALDLFEEIDNAQSKNMGQGASDTSAGQQVFDAVKFQAREKKRRAALQNQVASQRQFEISNYVNSRGENDPAAGYRALIERDDLANYTNLVAVQEEVLGRANGIIAKVIREFRPTITGGARNPDGMRNVVHELFGTKTGDAQAKNFAESLTAVFEYVRTRFNAAGGRIPKRKDFGMPQTHLKERLIEAGENAWHRFVIDRLDPEKMIDQMTGLPITRLALDAILPDIYEKITTLGLRRNAPDEFLGGKALGNKRLEHRFLIFKDSKAWLEYMDEFGEGDPFSVSMQHIDGMARDIARMEVFGPNDRAAQDFLKERVLNEASKRDARKGRRKGLVFTKSWTDYTRGVLKQSDDMYDIFTGEANSPVNEKFSSVMAGFRAFHASAVLGSAMISALSDINFQRIAAGFSDLPQAKLVGNVLKTLRGVDRLERMEVASRLGLIVDNMSMIANAQMRYVGEVMGPQIARRLSHTVLNISGLSPWTKAGRWGFGMTFLGELAARNTTPFAKLSEGMRGTMARYGISPDDWDLMRATELYDASRDVDGFTGKGTLFMNPKNIAERADLPRQRSMQLSNKLSRMVLGETEFAVPSSSIRGRSFLTQGARPGTLAGEFFRSFAMYKQFAATIVNTHLRRAISRPGGYQKGVALAELVITGGLMGALSLQLKEVIKGRDPREMFGDKGSAFWEQAILQGGGLGIWGDFILADTNRFGHSLGQQIAGPAVSFADDIFLKLAAGNIRDATRGEDTDIGRESVNILRRYMPGGSLWYARLGFERLIIDQLQSQVDPKFRQRVRARERRAKKDFGQKYWWKPGQTKPKRAPDFGAAFNQ